jgi:hypothetical protein
MNIRNVGRGILELDKMSENKNMFGKFTKMHLPPESTQTRLPNFEWL